jgi:hypothetical protein
MNTTGTAALSDARALAATFAACVTLAMGGSAAGQSPASAAKSASVVEVEGGYAGFVDDATIDHGVVGVSARYYLTPRVAVGPEFVYMRGPRFDRDIMLTGNLTVDFRRPAGSRPPRVTPYAVVGGGWFHHFDRFRSGPFSSGDSAFTAGGGVRVWASDRVYAGAEYRLGWELHYRVTGQLGLALGSR